MNAKFHVAYVWKNRNGNSGFGAIWIECSGPKVTLASLANWEETIRKDRGDTAEVVILSWQRLDD